MRDGGHSPIGLRKGCAAGCTAVQLAHQVALSCMPIVAVPLSRSSQKAEVEVLLSGVGAPSCCSLTELEDGFSLTRIFNSAELPVQSNS